VLSVELTVRDIGGHAVVALRGELDLASTPAVATHLIAAVAACGPSIIVDLAGLESIGYSGLGVLIRVRKWARENGGDLTLAAPRQQVRRILLATGLIDVFSVYPSVDQAADGAGAAHEVPAGAVPAYSLLAPALRPDTRRPSGGGDDCVRRTRRAAACARHFESNGPALYCGTHHSRYRLRAACRR
jgi:anti-sigma B factor antagonist